MVSIISIIAAFIIGIVALPSLPEQVAIHWGPGGEADDFANKYIGAFLLPLIMILLLILKIFLPNIDPKKKNYMNFSRPYNRLTEVIIVFMLVIQLTTTLINLGYDLNIETVMMLAIGSLFIIVGNYLPKVKHNYFVGIRTPWTLANERVWVKTHRFGGKAFMIFGVLTIIMLFIPIPKGYAVIIPIALLLISTTLMSYIYHKQEKEIEE